MFLKKSEVLEFTGGEPERFAPRNVHNCVLLTVFETSLLSCVNLPVKPTPDDVNVMAVTCSTVPRGDLKETGANDA